MKTREVPASATFPAGGEPALQPQESVSLRSRVVFLVLVLIVAAGALALRLPRLAERPMHTDEAVHAVKLGELLDHGEYIYNPHEYHGPTIYYFALPLLWVSGIGSFADIPNEIPLRMVPVLFGVGLVLLLLLIGDGLGRPAALAAGVLTALSPAMVFYSRYYIQEMLLVFFTFAAMALGWRFTRRRGWRWMLLAGGCLGLMHASKETAFIAWMAIIGAILLTLLWANRVDGRRMRMHAYFPKRHVIAVMILTALVALTVLSAFLTHPQALKDTFKAVWIYIQRALSGDSSTHGAGIHDHPWYYYLKMLAFFHDGPGPWWSEGLTLALALVAAFAALRPRSPLVPGNINLVRFLTFYTILLTTVYCVLSYKTPWCMLGFLHGMILLAGVGAVVMWRWLRRPAPRIALALLLLGGVWHLGGQAVRAISPVFSADTRNPYVYGHTSTNLLRLMRRVEDLRQVSPDGDEMVVKIFAPDADYWPLPWYLRRFPNQGYYQAMPDPPEPPDAALYISSPEMFEELEQYLKGYTYEYYSLRPEVFLVAWIRQDLMDAHIAKQAKK